MLSRHSLVMIAVSIICLVGAVACGATGRNSELGTAAAVPTAISATGEVQSKGVGIVVDVTPMSGADLAAQPQGQSPSGGGKGFGGGQSQPGPQGDQPQGGKMVVYSDSTYKFSIEHSTEFVIRTLPAGKLAQLEPRPAASILFMNPVIAASTVPDEPADLEVRVHAAGQSTSVEKWLTDNNLVPAGGGVPLTPFQSPHVSGIQVCASTMIAPGCSFYFLGNGWVYQLTPASQMGELMINTFRLPP